MAGFTFNFKLAVPAVKMTQKDKGMTTKMRQAAAKACTKGRTRSVTYIQASLKTSLDNSISSSWSWPGGAQDIVDTGALKNSLSLPVKHLQRSSTIQIKYDSPYAAAMHYGWVGHPYGNKNIAPRTYPGRPWIQSVLDGTNGQTKPDFDQIISDAFAAAWKDQFG